MDAPVGWPRARALLFLAAALAWSTGLFAPFQFDDDGVIVRDAAAHDVWTALTHPGLRPLLRVSYAACWQTGLGPLAFHLFNVGVHLLNVELVLRLSARATRPHAPASAPPDTVAVIAALLFALHPLHSEAVTYLSGRSVSLATTACLVALRLGAGGGGVARAAGGAVAMLVAVSVKETAATLPAGLLLWQLTVGGLGWTAALKRTAWAWVLLAGLAVVAVGYDPTFRLLRDVVGSVPLGQALARQLDGLAWVMSGLVRVEHLSIDPGFGFRPPSGAVVTVGAAIVVGLAAVAWRTRLPLVAFGLGWFLLQAFFPYLLLPRVDVLNERHLYLADVGLFLALGAWLAPSLEAWSETRLRVAAAITALVLGVGTTARNRDYRSAVALWRQTTAVSPQNPRAHYNLGVSLELEGRLAEASAAYVRALDLEPNLTDARARLRQIAAQIVERAAETPPAP